MNSRNGTAKWFTRISMLLENSFSKKLWAEAVNTAVFVLNRTNKDTVTIKKDVVFIKDVGTKEKDRESNEEELVEEIVSTSDQLNTTVQSVSEEIERADKENRVEDETRKCEDIKTARRIIKQPKWLGNFMSTCEPSSYEEATNAKDSKQWLEAIDREIDTLRRNNTWTEVNQCPEDANIVSSRWVFKIKEDINEV
ncbi:hypothetical protein QE152_g31920 [Popillia japonica]|uniref:Polyprotein n=1 Tax=Popillia japonica TaxID=7064 RepID=A0AAW1J0Y9_POPJA